MLVQLKTRCYDLIVWSGIINMVISVLKPVLVHLVAFLAGKPNHVIKDRSGATLNVTLYNGKIYPHIAQNNLMCMHDFKIRKDDVLLCGYPKTGCHWMHEIMHMIVTGKAELTKHGKELGGMIDVVPRIILDSLPSPRVLNSHLLYNELPVGVKKNKTRIVYTIRNPKDTLVSFYNHTKNLKEVYGYEGEFNNYFELFMAGKVDYGSYFDHLLSWDKMLKTQEDNRILMVSYEDIKANPKECVLQVAKFLKIPITEAFASDVVEACDFQKMKVKSKSFSGSNLEKLFRKGTVGDWRNWLTDVQSEEIDHVWHEKMMGCAYQPKY